MIKIDISLVRKYINGEELGNYSREQLENDKDFIMEVINNTNNPNIYFSCSERLKKDYNFVKFLVLKFWYDAEFIKKVADYYLNNVDSEIERIELNILMSELLPNDLSNKYKVSSETAYCAKRVAIEIAKAEDPNLEAKIGKGFLLIFDSYNGSDIILKYYAKKMIDEIIKDNDINFETMLHNQFKSPLKIEEKGINNYIINFIGYYDSMLSSYISTHLDLISNIRNEIRNIQSNWNKYKMADEAKRYNSMLNMIHEYMSISESSMSETELLYFVAKELGVKDKVEHYDNPYSSEEEFSFDFDEEVIEDMIQYEIENNLKERIVYLNVRKIMMNQLFSSKPADLYSIINVDEDKKPNNSGKTKIINFKPKDKKDNK